MADEQGNVLTEHQHRFHLEEYKVAREEIAATIKRVYDIFFGAALASAAIAAWLLTNADKVGLISPVAQRIAWFIPFGVALIGCFGFYHLDYVIGRVAAYAQKLESLLGMKGMGWETSQAADPQTSAQKQARLLLGLGWVVILGADLVLGLFGR